LERGAQQWPSKKELGKMGRKRREIKPKWQTKQTQLNTQNGIQQKIIKRRKKSNSANRNVYSLEV